MLNLLKEARIHLNHFELLFNSMKEIKAILDVYRECKNTINPITILERLDDLMDKTIAKEREILTEKSNVR